MIGSALRQYRILRALGSGGMGEVYAAEDTRLHRLVALKLLPSDMALDPERLERFEREAQAVAALNHPNVVTLYGVEQAGDVRFLAMELVEGETLGDLIPGEGLSLAKFLDLAIQLADAISAAHQRGIVHRDLKPANVMVTAEGRVKILDFGLAKLRREGSGAGEGETRTVAELTAQHHVIGTAAYMSPEQAEGRAVDARSDIFSLGVVLYQMATGARPFRGDTAVSVISAILKDTPPLPSSVRPRIPSRLDRIVRRCLAKDPADRYQSAGDLRHDLLDVRDEAGPSTRPARGARLRTGVIAAAVVVLAIAAVSVVLWRARRTGSAPALPPKMEFARLTTGAGIEWFPSLSPDGKWIVYAADAPGWRHIFLQSVTGHSVFDLTKDSTWDEEQPAFSPDGERIAFRSSREGGGIFVMGRTGEAVRRVTRAGFNPAWSPDGTRLVYSLENVELNPQNSLGRAETWVVTVETGEARRLTEGDATLPSWSPHDRRIAYAARLRDRLKGSLWTMKVDGTDSVAIPGGGGRDWNPVWSPDGRFLYFVSDRGGSMNLWRVPIDEASGRTLGDAQPLTTPATSLAHVTISGDGTRIAYSSAQVTSNIQALPFNPVTGTVTGEPSWVTTGSARWANPDPSPDGQWVAFYSLVDPEGHVQVARTDGSGVVRQVTGDSAIDRVPRWSPDGRWIAFFSTRSGHLEIWRVRPDGSELQQLTHGGGSYFAWSPDGSRMATFHNVEEQADAGDVYLFDPNRPWNEQTLEHLPAFGSPAWRFWVSAWSPDGARLAAFVGPGTTRGIGVYSIASRRYELLTDFGEFPAWLPDSRRILFVSGGKAFYTVDTRTKEVKRVFSAGRDIIAPARLTRDGRRLYFIRRVTESDIWMATLR